MRVLAWPNKSSEFLGGLVAGVWAETTHSAAQVAYLGAGGGCELLWRYFGFQGDRKSVV